MAMTETAWRRASREFASRLVLVKVEAGRLGLWRTMHALDKGTQAVGWEIARIEDGRQVAPWRKRPAKVRVGRKRWTPRSSR